MPKATQPVASEPKATKPAAPELVPAFSEPRQESQGLCISFLKASVVESGEAWPEAWERDVFTVKNELTRLSSTSRCKAAGLRARPPGPSPV